MDTTRLRERVTAIVLELPDATVTGDQHLALAVRHKFYLPAYLGTRGWVGLRLDRGRVNWGEVRELLTEAYRLQAPRKLAALLDQGQAGSPSPR